MNVVFNITDIKIPLFEFSIGSVTFFEFVDN